MAHAAVVLAEEMDAAANVQEAALPALAAPKPRQRRQRVFVDAHKGVGSTAGRQQQDLGEVENEYERQASKGSGGAHWAACLVCGRGASG